VLGLKVTSDFGIYNVGFEGGLSLYKKTLFQDLVGGIEILDKPNNFVLYFEYQDLEDIERQLEARGFEFVHRIQEQPWGQPAFRVYDYDNHILEIAETMDEVMRRMHRSGQTIEEIAGRTGYSTDEVSLMVREHR
jgi:catechol 2,3-dioxygenase-like lactoylglutathione lyase family enzyme